MPTMPIFSKGRFVIALLLAATVAAGPLTARPVDSASGQKPLSANVINFIGHETSEERTRVILHASGPIDYRGGALRGDQVILDLANIEVSLPTPVVEVGAPEVDRVVIGPEISRDGEKLLKVRLTGVRARMHKVMAVGNELHVDLTPLAGARGQHKGLPRIITNDTEIMASAPSAPAETLATYSIADEMMAVPLSEPVISMIPAIPATASIASEPVTPKAQPETASIPEPPLSDGPIRLASMDPGAVMAALSMPAAVVSAAVVPAAVVPSPVFAASPAAESMSEPRVLRVATGRSLTLATGIPVARVSISNPAVAETLAISPTQMLINGLTPGVASLVLWPKVGDPIVYELVVHIDTESLATQLNTIFPSERVRVQSSKDSVVLSGPVSTHEIGEKMVKLASDYSSKVLNHLSGPGASRRQVMLKVKFAEVSKTALTELGSVLHHVDPLNPGASDRGSSGTGEFAPPSGNLLNNPVGPDFTWGDAINLSFFEKTLDLGVFITALKSRGLFQELAEPTLIAADGQEASFLAGGEFPVPIAQPGSNFVAVTIQWKKFGISLDFKPTIRNDGVIVLKVKPEVSSLDFSNAILLEGFRIPSVIVRRAETEVELRSGQAFAIAGLYDQNLLQTKSKMPVLGDIPLLGYLFRSKNLQKGVTELLVIVTPTIIEPLGSESEAKLPEMDESFDLSKTKTK